MANITRKWKKVMGIGCRHGELAHLGISDQVIAFRDSYKPDIRFDLGDVLDTTAFRSGVKGTKDEKANPGRDFWAGKNWLERYEPTHIAWGNHDARLLELSDSPNGVTAHAAATLWNDLQDTAAHLHAKTVPYDFQKGWFDIGGHLWGHGYWYNEAAVRDTAEFFGRPVVMAHIHTPMVVEGRTWAWSQSFCVGMLADAEKLTYNRRRRATSRHGHGLVFGEISDTEAHLWLASCPPGGKLRFPFKI